MAQRTKISLPGIRTRTFGVWLGAASLALLVDCSSQTPDTGGVSPPAPGTSATGAEPAATGTSSLLAAPRTIDALTTAASKSPRLAAALATAGGYARDGATFHSPVSRGLMPEAGPAIAARLPVRSSEEVRLSTGDDARYHVLLSPLSPIDQEGVLENGRVTYAGAHRGVDLVRTASAGEVHEMIVLHDPDAPTVFGWAAVLGAGIQSAVTQIDGSLLLTDEDGNVRLRFFPPKVVDAEGHEANGDLTWADDRLQLRIPDKLPKPVVIHWGAEGIDPGKKPPPPPPPAQIKARVMVLIDTSGSMVWHFTDNNTCGGDGDTLSLFTDGSVTNQNYYPGTNLGGGNFDGKNSRMYAAKKAFLNAVSASSNIDYGLMRYGPNGSCPNSTTCCTLGGAACVCHGDFINYTGGCGNGVGKVTWSGSCSSGQVLVTPSATSAAGAIEWVDNVEDFRTQAGKTFGRNPELRPAGPTPLAASITTALNSWYTPIYNTSKNTPGCSGASCDPQLDCRPYVLVAMTDGADTCAADGINDPPNAVAALHAKNATNPVSTYVIGLAFINGDPAISVLNNMATQGGTTNARFANNQSQIQAAFADIAAASTKFEVCNNLDDTCNGLIDEGLNVFQECSAPAQCGSGTCNAGRCTCTTNAQCAAGYGCDAGLCRPACATGTGECAVTGVRKCSGGASTCCKADGLAACSPLVAGTPKTEVCNGKDDNCNGLIDENGVCQQCQPTPESCDGKDNDCDGIIDNNLTDTGKACGLNIGECKPGITVCVPNAGFTFPHSTDHIVCSGGVQPTAELCNNKDDDCDGQIDGQTQTCYSGPNGTAGVGICASGQQKCTAGAFGSCIGEIVPKTEVCNGLDDDCNGSIDDVAGLNTSCCPSGKCGTGICTAGTNKCSGGALQCIGGQGPATEICDGLDNDCNGLVDDVPGVDQTCCPSGKCGVGVCTAGVGKCQGNQVVCTGGSGPTGEICDGLDNDCNGKVDDLPGAGTACCPPGVNCGVGVCKGGTLGCAAGSQTLSCLGSQGPSAETCDGLDNDCNGLVDDVPGSGASCCPSGNCGVGQCKAGVQKCQGGSLVCVGNVGPSAEVCDGVDNDCNGKTDDLTGIGNKCCPFKDTAGKDVCEVGICKGGTLQCVTGSLTPQCVNAIGPSPEVCDGKDNDCNGKVDDLPGGQVGGDCCPSGKCGVGVCAGGKLSCGPNGLECKGAVNPTAELCDGLDNDCNGKIDDIPGVGTECCPSGACGKGICKAGVLKCTATGLVCEGAVNPQPESCNGIDDDCNGIVDDVPGVNEACCPEGSPAGPAPDACNKGECAPGTKKCDTATGKLTCSGGKAPGKELCDGKDNDCNGVIDDPDQVSKNDTTIGQSCDPPTSPNDKPPCKPGKTVCSGGKAVCDGGVKPEKEVCDGVDNDCDGVKDQGDLCGNGKACISAVCVEPCGNGEFPCPGGFHCLNNYCVPDAVGTGGNGGSGGSGGKAGASGTGTGGSSGSGNAGKGGSSGAAGSSANGGSAGKAGSSGSAASGGAAASAGASGNAGKAGTATAAPAGTNNYGLATGGGGCACETTGAAPRSYAFGLLGLVATALAARRRQRGAK